MRLLQTFMLFFIAQLSCQSVVAAVSEIQIEIRDHLFFPSTVEIPANQKVRLFIINNDPTPEEFESYELIGKK